MFDKMSLWFYLLQGRVNTSDVFGVTNSDLVPGKYEGEEKIALLVLNFFFRYCWIAQSC